MANKQITIELNDKQQKKFDKWLSHIKAIYCEVGLLTWKCTPNGIGSELRVFSHLTRTEIDLTDVDSW
jgi:hypothetical protein